MAGDDHVFGGPWIAAGDGRVDHLELAGLRLCADHRADGHALAATEARDEVVTDTRRHRPSEAVAADGDVRVRDDVDAAVRIEGAVADRSHGAVLRRLRPD